MRYNHIQRANGITNKIFEQQEQFLKAHGECRGIIDKGDTTEVYYSYKDSALRILYENTALSSVTKITTDAMERILTCANLKFGD